MTRYTRTRRNFLLEVIEENGTFTARLTDLTTAATSSNPGWKYYETALQVVQEMYTKAQA